MSAPARTAYLVGIDLSGPTNTADTAGFAYRSADACSAEGCSADGCSADASLELVGGGIGLGDRDILELVAMAPAGARVAVGLDAPLSYNPGGGDRPPDRELRRRLVSVGMHPGSVMTPTMTRMAYLTLRGLAVARAIEQSRPDAAIVEVHPGGAMALRDAGVTHVSQMKRSAIARESLAKWLATRGIPAPADVAQTDHGIAALACVLAVREHERGHSVFDAPAAPPLHPFPFVC